MTSRVRLNRSSAAKSIPTVARSLERTNMVQRNLPAAGRCCANARKR